MASGSFGALAPTLEGYYVQEPQDALVIIQLVLEGKLAMVHRRPKEAERQYVIKSGNVFVFKEMKGHIQRWTDGITWSASRILTPFLVYRQDSKAPPKNEGSNEHKKSNLSHMGAKTMKNAPNARISKLRKLSADSIPVSSIPVDPQAARELNNTHDYYGSSYYAQKELSMIPQMASHEGNLLYHGAQVNNAHGYSQSAYASEQLSNRDYQLFGSLKDANFADDGLAKKTISVKYQGVPYRLISYFTKPDVIQHRLKRPLEDPMFQNVVIEKELQDSIQENKTAMDIPELYYLPAQGQYSAPPQIHTYTGYAPQIPLPGYPPEYPNQQMGFDQLGVYPDGNILAESGSRSFNKPHTTLPAMGYNRMQSYNMYPSAAPSQWFHNANTGFRTARSMPQGSIHSSSEGYDNTLVNNPARTEINSRFVDSRSVPGIHIAGHNSARHTSASSLSTTPFSLSTDNRRKSRTSDSGQIVDDEAQHTMPMRQTKNDLEITDHGNQADALTGNNPLAEESIEGSPPRLRQQHEDLLTSMSPDSSPLEPPINTGSISATTFIPQNYDFCDSENSNNTAGPPNTPPAPGLDHSSRQSRPMSFRSPYASQGHGPTPSKKSPNIYFSAGQAWN